MYVCIAELLTVHWQWPPLCLLLFMYTVAKRPNRISELCLLLRVSLSFLPILRLGCWLDSFLLIELVLAEALWASPSDVIAVCIVISSNWVLTGKCKRCPTIPDWLLNCRVCECEPCRTTITTKTTQPLLCSQRNWEMLTHSLPYYSFTLSRSLCIHLRNTVIE